MTQLVLLEPQDSIAWSPFLGVRPIAELRAGVWKIRERWEAALELETVAFSGAIQGFNEFDESRAPVELDAGRKIVVVRSDFVPLAQWAAGFDDSVALVHGGELVGWIMNQDEDPAKLPTAEVAGLWLRGAFDLVTALDKLAGPDCDAFLDRPSDPLPPQSIVQGDPSRIRILGAEVEPGVVFDVRHGAVIIEQGAEVRNGTRLEGPCYVGTGTRVVGQTTLVLERAAANLGPAGFLRLMLGYNHNRTKATQVVPNPEELGNQSETLFGRVERARIEEGQPRDNVLASASYDWKRLGVVLRTHNRNAACRNCVELELGIRVRVPGGPVLPKQFVELTAPDVARAARGLGIAGSEFGPEKQLEAGQTFGAGKDQLDAGGEQVGEAEGR